MSLVENLGLLKGQEGVVQLLWQAWALVATSLSDWDFERVERQRELPLGLCLTASAVRIFHLQFMHHHLLRQYRQLDQHHQLPLLHSLSSKQYLPQNLMFNPKSSLKQVLRKVYLRHPKARPRLQHHQHPLSKSLSKSLARQIETE